MKPQKLKRAVIKEEFVALTGNCEQAIILNQFDYWAHRANDTDDYIQEEIARQQDPEAIDILEKLKTSGWIYKSTKQLLDEVMLSISQSTARRHLVKLVEHGWLQERDNPNDKWDKRKQYRYNLAKVQEDLLSLGYPLEGWKIIFDASKRHGDKWDRHGDEWDRHGDASGAHSKPTPDVAAIESGPGPEITIEITAETTKAKLLPDNETEAVSQSGKTAAANLDQENLLQYVQVIVQHYQDLIKILNKSRPKDKKHRLVPKPRSLETLHKGLEGKYRTILKWFNDDIPVDHVCQRLTEWMEQINPDPKIQIGGSLNFFDFDRWDMRYLTPEYKKELEEYRAQVMAEVARREEAGEL